MVSAALDKQLLINVNNQVGVLAHLMEVISLADINMVAICGYAVANQGIVMIVTEDNEKAKQLLIGKGYQVREEEIVVLTVKNKPGALQSLTKKIADAGIDVTLVYGSVDKNLPTTRIVLLSQYNNAILKAFTI